MLSDKNGRWRRGSQILVHMAGHDGEGKQRSWPTRQGPGVHTSLDPGGKEWNCLEKME